MDQVVALVGGCWTQAKRCEAEETEARSGRICLMWCRDSGRVGRTSLLSTHR